MTIKIERSSKPKRLKGKTKKKGYLTRIGFTNSLAVFILAFIAIGLAGGFYLALKSIATGYTGALMCWTVVFTPIGTACSVVLGAIVHKSTVENSGADGEGIKYAAAKAAGFVQKENVMDSPPI